MSSMQHAVNLVKVTRAYMETHRQYHNLNHILRMFTMAREHKRELTDEQVVAIWYHDIIYDPQATNNEEMSAIVAGEDIGELCACPHSLGVIQQIIRDTENHIPNHPMSKLVIDLDLAGLGDPEDQYLATGKLVRAEYSHLSDKQWAEGRVKFLERFIGRRQIFYTEWGLEHFERNAFNNMTKELWKIHDTFYR